MIPNPERHHPLRILSDDTTTNVETVRPSSYGYAQPDPTRRSHKRKHPLGFDPPPKRKAK